MHEPVNVGCFGGTNLHALLLSKMYRNDDRIYLYAYDISKNT